LLSPESLKRNQLVRLAVLQIGVKEKTGNNDGKMVETYLHAVGLKKGAPWCAAFVSWLYKQAGLKEPHTGWSADLFPKGRLVKEVVPANVFGIYFPRLGRIAHCGLIERSHGHWVQTIEGNTSSEGSREGDGVYRKLRHLKCISKMSDWLGKERKK
jgi:hypothetical protein